ncbi:hypothetical protein B0E48_17315 [Rhodanobacter sp. C03]|nr:hypothetical protein B0E48_17315 [Rhodanobacter sp. C03]
MDQVSIVCRRRHLSRRTEEAYRYWIRQYIFFHRKRHPRDVGPAGTTPLINDLVVRQIDSRTPHHVVTMFPARSR